LILDSVQRLQTLVWQQTSLGCMVHLSGKQQLRH
jgi:hypothetical protein